MTHCLGLPVQIISDREDRWDGARLIKFDFQVCTILKQLRPAMYRGIANFGSAACQLIKLCGRLRVQALFAIPIIVFGFNCHANVVSVFK